MDPVGPWYYNRLTNASSGFQSSGSSSSGDYHQPLGGHQGGTAAGSVSSTPSQLLLQAAHSTSLTPSPFNPAGFLPQTVGYDVFSPLFQHAHSKSAHYSVSQHRALASAMASTAKQSESEAAPARENYSAGAAHHQSLSSTSSAFYEHQGATTTPSPSAASSLGWHHQGASQLPSPFGVLPHESVVSSTGNAAKTGADYAAFNAFNAAHGLSHLTSSLADYKASSGYAGETKKVGRSHSPSSTSVKSAASSSSSAPSGFYQGSSAASSPSPYGASDSGISGGYSPTHKYSAAVPQQSCIVSSPSSTPPGKEYRSQPSTPRYPASSTTRDKPGSPCKSSGFVAPSVKSSQPQHAVQSKAQSKVYSEQAASMLDSAPPAPLRTPSGQQSPYHQQLHQSYRHYSSASSAADTEYHRSKAGADEQQPYVQHNGAECRRSSPHSPAYPMYHSPMQQAEGAANRCSSSSSSSNSGSDTFKAAAAPLDVSVARTPAVAYPSVITRAMSTPDTQACARDWDTGTAGTDAGSEGQRKYQQSQWPMQALASCRDDPMTIVKNLQQEEARPASKPASKRRRSSEKDSHSDRVPPPAHHNTTPMQQQNGSYFDLERWNFPPPAARPFGGSPNALQHAANAFVGSQHQGLGAPHAAPYFSPYHLPSPAPSAQASPHEYASGVNHQTPSQFDHSTAPFHQQAPPVRASSPAPPPARAPAPARNPAPARAPARAPASNRNRAASPPRHPDKNPKVIVPNIEEELGFLDKTGPVIVNKAERKGRPNGFEASYLRFLQGDPEDSPPPVSRAEKKKPYHPEPRKPPDATVTNGNATSKPISASSTTSVVSKASKTKQEKEPPVYDVEDDPRYFPLPKTDAQRRSLDSSDSDSDIDLNTKLKSRQVRILNEPQSLKTKAKSSAKKVKPSKPVDEAPEKGKRGRKKKIRTTEEVPLPRRETSKRKAKEKTNLILDRSKDFFPDDPDASAGSDSDPAWTPIATKPKADSSDEEAGKRKASKKGLVFPRKRLKILDKADVESSDNEEKHSINHSRPAPGPKGRRKSQNVQVVVSNANTSSKDGTNRDEDGEAFPFKIGDFVVMKTDLSEKWPPIWKVDGKLLLQKFEPFEESGETLYRNISTYSGWSPQNRHAYRIVEVIFRVNNKTETVVQFLREELVEDKEEMLETLMQETAQFQDHFEVYIQTLISQALDSNFLTEIFQEQDDYFLSNVKTVDEIVEERRRKFLCFMKWRPELERSIGTWPCYDVIFEMTTEEGRKKCASCGRHKVSARVILYGQPYNSTTLEGCQPDPKLVNEKNFLTCKPCLRRIELYNKVAHQKYLMFIECAKRVGEKRAADASKDTTAILNELLADDKWLNQLFRDVRLSWAEIDRLKMCLEARSSTISHPSETPTTQVVL